MTRINSHGEFVDEWAPPRMRLRGCAAIHGDGGPPQGTVTCCECGKVVERRYPHQLTCGGEWCKRQRQIHRKRERMRELRKKRRNTG